MHSISKEIHLIRHGKVNIESDKKLSTNEMVQWIYQYDENEVNEEDQYPEATILCTKDEKLIFTSDLKRSVQSAQILNKAVSLQNETIFRECEVPHPPSILALLRLKPKMWLIILRLLWLFGYSKNCESYALATQRAKQAAAKLIEMTNQNQSITLVGHGVMNRLIAKQLKKSGWQEIQATNHTNWSVCTYRSNNDCKKISVS